MAKYHDDFQSYSTGAGLPTGWTSRWDGGTWSIVDDAGDKFLRQVDTSANRRLATWDTIDSDADRDDVEILATIKSASNNASNAHMGIAARCSGSDTTETGYALVMYGDELVINRYSSGTNTQLGLTTTLSISANTKYKLRFRLNGTSLKGRVWLDGDSEPGTWNVDVTDSTISAAGWCGCFGFAYIAGAPDDNHDWYRIAVATNGDTAEFGTFVYPATGHAVVTGYVPAVSQGGGTTVNPTTGHATVAGYVPIIVQGSTVAAFTGHATITGYVSTVTQARIVNPTTGHAAITGYAPNVTQMVLSASYERASVILSTSSITGVGDSAIISIRPKVQESESGNFSAGEWLEPSAQVAGVNGYRPTFRFLNYFNGDNGMLGADASWSSTRRPMYSYDDGLTWTYFDTAVTRDTSNDWIEFRNSTAFTSNTVRIGRSRQMTVHQVGDWLASTATTYSSFFVPAASAVSYTPTGSVSGFAAQTFIADEYSTQTDSLGLTVPVMPLYAAEINDTSLMPLSGNPKRVAVVTGGVHGGEDHGNHVLKSFIAAVCGASAEAQALRRQYRILIYPMINAPGRAGGGWRGSWTQGTVGADDANRHFHESGSALEIVDKPKALFTTDCSGEIPDWHIDFHGDWGGTWGVIADNANTIQASFISKLTTFSGQTVTDVGTPLAGFLSKYFETLGARLHATHESGDTVQISDGQITTHGTGIVQTINSMMGEGVFGVFPATGHAVLTGYNPIVTQGAGQTLSPATGHSIIIGYEPSVARGISYSPSTGHLGIVGYSPTVTQNGSVNVFPATGHAILIGYAPTITQNGGFSGSISDEDIERIVAAVWGSPLAPTPSSIADAVWAKVLP